MEGYGKTGKDGSFEYLEVIVIVFIHGYLMRKVKVFLNHVIYRLRGKKSDAPTNDCACLMFVGMVREATSFLSGLSSYMPFCTRYPKILVLREIT